jgi:hypothetical protein
MPMRFNETNIMFMSINSYLSKETAQVMQSSSQWTRMQVEIDSDNSIPELEYVHPLG